MNTCLEMSSPRISCSLDFDHLDFIPVELTLPSLPPSSNPAFEFGTHGSSESVQSSADELFENGVILPSLLQMRQAPKCEEEEETQEREARLQPIPFLSPLHLCPSSTGNATQETAEENGIEITGKNPKPGEGEKIQKKSWGFRRSSSLGSEYSKTMSFLFPLPVLSRSNSVSSAASAPRNQKRRPLQKQQPSLSRMRKSSSSSWSSIKVAPVLNVPPRRASRGTVNLSGFGCLSLWGKERKSRGYGD